MSVHGQMLRSLALAALAPSLVFSLLSSPAHAQSLFIGSSDPTPKAVVDPTKPVSRGYITVDAKSAVGGADLTVEVFQDRLNSEVRLSLLVAIATQSSVAGQTAGTFAIPLKLLSPGTMDSKYYYQKETFRLDYAQLQAYFEQAAPNAKNLRIEPGTALVVKADFMPTGASGGWEHNWGGFDRGGAFFLPAPLDQNGKPIVSGQAQQVTNSMPAARPTALDLAFNIPTTMTNIFNDRQTGDGLKPGGQIRSRVEGEGKFQLTEQEYLDIKKVLLDVAQDANKASNVLGPDWTIKFEDRYLKKDAQGNLLRGADGLPIPDPMVDTYTDNKNYQAAKNDMAFRYRWTEGNQTGSWNFKPGIGRREANGVVYRVEFGVDTTNDKPESLKAFADSFHPLNPFQHIRQIIPGAAPSEFLTPAVRLEDERYKFKLKHRNGLEIEISIDDCKAFDLRHGRPATRFYQLEMDIAHLATASANVIGNTQGSIKGVVYNDASGVRKTFASPFRWTDDKGVHDAVKSLLGSLGADAVFDGRPVLHDATDLEAKGSLLSSRKADFDASADIINRVRDHVLPNGFTAGAQKYAFAAAALGLIKTSDVSSSVKMALPQLRAARGVTRAGMCVQMFGK